MASYLLNESAVTHARRQINARQYVLNSERGDVQPNADAQNAYLERALVGRVRRLASRTHRWAGDETKARHAFVYGDFRRVRRSGLLACVYRAAQWRHKAVEFAAHELLQHLDATYRQRSL